MKIILCILLLLQNFCSAADLLNILDRDVLNLVTKFVPELGTMRILNKKTSATLTNEGAYQVALAQVYGVPGLASIPFHRDLLVLEGIKFDSNDAGQRAAYLHLLWTCAYQMKRSPIRNHVALALFQHLAVNDIDLEEIEKMDQKFLKSVYFEALQREYASVAKYLSKYIIANSVEETSEVAVVDRCAFLRGDFANCQEFFNQNNSAKVSFDDIVACRADLPEFEKFVKANFSRSSKTIKMETFIKMTEFPELLEYIGWRNYFVIPLEEMIASVNDEKNYRIMRENKQILRCFTDTHAKPHFGNQTEVERIAALRLPIRGDDLWEMCDGTKEAFEAEMYLKWMYLQNPPKFIRKTITGISSGEWRKEVYKHAHMSSAKMDRLAISENSKAFLMFY